MSRGNKFLIIILSVLLIFALLDASVTLIKKRGYGLTYQVTSSMPKGLYLLEPIREIQRGDTVIFYPPQNTLKFLLKKHWIPDDGLLMKKVFAIPGDTVCKKHNFLWINGKKIARVYRYYNAQHELPQKKFCSVLSKDQYLLMSLKVKRSYDGRYFGPVSRSHMIAKGKKI